MNLGLSGFARVRAQRVILQSILYKLKLDTSSFACMRTSNLCITTILARMYVYSMQT